MILVFIVVGILALLVGVGIWFTFGPGGKDVRDPIAEHARLHELGIAHGHEGKAAYMLGEDINGSN
tara:strand:+ start:710 stop:907 length:198 start_codon:yes stop_codon:yes gene_type:complete